MNRKFAFNILTSLLLVLGLSFKAYAGTPTEQLKSSVDAILATLKNKSLDKQARRGKIREIVNDRFYFKAMSQQTLSRNWRRASKQQRHRFVELFAKLLENTYIGRIEAYTNEKVEYLREKQVTDKRYVVYTQIVAADKNIPINYKLALKNGKWLVYDVIIEEVSLISNYRNSYNEIIRKEGMEALLNKMAQKVGENENNSRNKNTS